MLSNNSSDSICLRVLGFAFSHHFAASKPVKTSTQTRLGPGHVVDCTSHFSALQALPQTLCVFLLFFFTKKLWVQHVCLQVARCCHISVLYCASLLWGLMPKWLRGSVRTVTVSKDHKMRAANYTETGNGFHPVLLLISLNFCSVTSQKHFVQNMWQNIVLMWNL